MQLKISATAGMPIYQQLHEQIVAQILSGEICEGFCLPSIRTVAKELGVSIITIKKAWDTLEASGYITTMVGKGCFVAPGQVQGTDSRREAVVTERLRKDLPYYRALGIDLEQLLHLIRKIYTDIE